MSKNSGRLEKLEELRELTKKAVEIRKKIKEYSEKLNEVKQKFAERAKDKNFSFTIKVDEGSIRAIRNKRDKLFKIKTKDFDKLDRSVKNKLYKSGLLGIRVFLKTDKYEEALKQNSIPSTLGDLVFSNNVKPFRLSVFIDEEDKLEMSAIEEEIIYQDEDDDYDEEFFEDLSLNLYPPDYRNFTDNDPADLSELEKQELGIEEDKYPEDDEDEVVNK